MKTNINEFFFQKRQTNDGARLEAGIMLIKTDVERKEDKQFK